MTGVRNTTGEHRTAKGRLVLDGAVLEVEADEVYGFTCQPHWSGDPERRNWVPADDEAQAIHDEADALANAVEEALAEHEPPAGNASRDVWAAWVVAAGLATEDEIDGMGRDELRDTYTTPEG